MENLPIFQDLLNSTAKIGLKKLRETEDINEVQYNQIFEESKIALVVMFERYKGNWALMSENILKYQSFLLKQLKEK